MAIGTLKSTIIDDNFTQLLIDVTTLAESNLANTPVLSPL